MNNTAPRPTRIVVYFSDGSVQDITLPVQFPSQVGPYPGVPFPYPPEWYKVGESGKWPYPPPNTGTEIVD